MAPLSAAMIEYCFGGTAPAPPPPGTAAPVPGQGRRAPAGPPPARSKSGRKTAERVYAIETLREGALRILRAEHAGARPPSARVVSREAGHFIKNNMMPELGRGQEPVIFFVDGNSLRCSLLAVLTVLEHNVCLVCITLHPSV